MPANINPGLACLGFPSRMAPAVANGLRPEFSTDWPTKGYCGMTPSDLDLGPSYLIFGATGGIGSELCRHLAGQGARLVLAGRNEVKLQALADEIRGFAYAVDATVFEDVEACVEKAVQMHTQLDGIVCCVGSLLLKPAHATSATEWGSTIATNLTSAFAVVRAGTRAMTTTGGSIVLVSSAAARVGLANHEAIAAAKAGIIGLTLSAAATYAPRGTRVNCVAPGLVETPMTARLTANEASLKASTAMHPLGRIGKPADVAAAIEWLLNPRQSWVTGQVLGIDGGLGSVRSRSSEGKESSMSSVSDPHQSPPWAHRWLWAAGLYNLAWGGLVIALPNLLFDLCGIDRLNYPEIWQCVGMIVGVYGIGYIIAAGDSRKHWPIVLAGLLGKIFGPIGFATALGKGTFPPVFGLTILTNDLIWWVPFAMILRDAATHQDDTPRRNVSSHEHIKRDS